MRSVLCSFLCSLSRPFSFLPLIIDYSRKRKGKWDSFVVHTATSNLYYLAAICPLSLLACSITFFFDKQQQQLSFTQSTATVCHETRAIVATSSVSP